MKALNFPADVQSLAKNYYEITKFMMSKDF